MLLEQMLTQVRWPIEYSRIDALNKKDSKIYKKLFIALMLASVLLLFFFVVGLIFTLPLSAFLLFYYLKNKNNTALALICKIKNKECWHRENSPFYRADDPEYRDMESTQFILEVDILSAYMLKGISPQKTLNHPSPRHILVNQKIFDSFRSGEQIFIIHSASNDLLGYYFQGEIVLLIKEKKLSNKEIYQSSISISQEFKYPPDNSFERIL
jgi:hypothetical protein